MMMSEDTARQIHAQHWRQGRLLPVASHVEITQHLSGVLLADDDAVIVISRSVIWCMAILPRNRLPRF